MNQRVLARVDLGRIAENYKRIAEISHPSRVCAVVKADAYGHGAVAVSKKLYELGCRDFAVACLSEAQEIRDCVPDASILILGPTDSQAIAEVAKGGFVQTVDSIEAAEEASKHGLRVHIKIDTGMSRIGIYCHSENDIERTADSIEQIASLDGIRVDGIFTHFADSDGDGDAFTNRQHSVFSALIDELDRRGIDVGTKHCCNSAATIRYPNMHLDMVRAGIILYGLFPSPEVADAGIAPAMKLSARVCAIHELFAGDCVSYGCTFRAEKDTRIAVISIGYADGFSRVYSGKELITINGRRFATVGRICMDMCMIEIGNDFDCRVGDEAVIFESSDDIDRLASALGTINYEILCSLKHRVKLEYK